MTKVRSKLKRHAKGKSWKKGESGRSNPEQMKHRLKAKSRFFQPLLTNGSTTTEAAQPTLTMASLRRHDQSNLYNAEKTTVNDVVDSMQDLSFNNEDNEDMSITESGTHQTYKTFASSYSNCSNVSFKKLLNGFRTSSAYHQEMLAILTALTEIIKERDGKETSTEYFLLLLDQIEASSSEVDIAAGCSLLAMDIKNVPHSVLRHAYGQCVPLLLKLLEKYAESGNQTIIRKAIECLAILLSALDSETWLLPDTIHKIDAILSFTIHSKPKIRRVAQHAVIRILFNSDCIKNVTNEVEADTEPIDAIANNQQQKPKKYHPIVGRVAKFCLAQLNQEAYTKSQTTLLHNLTMIKMIISTFKNDDIRAIAEQLLSIMSAPNVMTRTLCLEVLHSLFSMRSVNLNDTLCAKLVAALHEFQPDRNDIQQTLAWVAVLSEGYLHLATLNLKICINSIPAFIDVCANELWMSDATDLVGNVALSLKNLITECVAEACGTKELATTYAGPVKRIFLIINKALNTPFGASAKYVIRTVATLFEACGAHFSKELEPLFVTVALHYDTQNTLRIHIEHAIISGIKALGPECVLNAFPISNSNGVILAKSWLLPLLREGITGATFQYFKQVIMPLAIDCNVKWNKHALEKETAMSHTYELLCCQLWSLFPGFCRKPKDPEYFRFIAPTLAKALNNNPEFRAPILDGFIELLKNEEDTELQSVLASYAKNFLPRLFDIYREKPSGTYDVSIRENAYEVIKLWLRLAPNDVSRELYDSAKTQLTKTTIGTFEYDVIYDINLALVLQQTSETIRNFYETFIMPTLLNSKSKLVAKDEQKLKRQQRRTYQLLSSIMTSELPSCQKFVRKNAISLQKLLFNAFKTTCSMSLAARLKCLKILIERRNGLTYNDEIVMKTIPEAVLNFRNFSTRKENIADALIQMISNLYQGADKINDLVDILTAGLTGDELLITNTILALRAVMQHQGRNLTVSTLEFLLQQISVFLVQKPRSQAEASVAFLITFIKVMPVPLIANHLESIMRSLSAMTKDNKRYCRIQIGYLLKKLCKHFAPEEVTKYVPGDDLLTHRRLKKLPKQLRREKRKKLLEESAKKNADGVDDEDDGLKEISLTIDDILTDSDSESDSSSDEGIDNKDSTGAKRGDKSKNKDKKKSGSIYIREDVEDIVDLADIKSVGNVLTNHPGVVSGKKQGKDKAKDSNRGFKVADDGRLIISDKAALSDDDDDDDDDKSEHRQKTAKLGMEDDSSDEEDLEQTAKNNRKNKRKASDALSMRSGRTNDTRYTTGGKGIHRNVGSDAMSAKSGHTSSNAFSGKAYATKKAKGDMKKPGKLDPYAYIPLSRNSLNKRKRAQIKRKFKNEVSGVTKTGKVKKPYK